MSDFICRVDIRVWLPLSLKCSANLWAEVMQVYYTECAADILCEIEREKLTKEKYKPAKDHSWNVFHYNS